jgi:hypothetical protein
MQKILAFFLCCLFFFSQSLSAASSLFHAMIAEKWIKAFENFNEEETRAFMIGTLFPDIRYLAGLPRSKTHLYHLSLEQIRAIKDPFLKGMRVHAFVDETREGYLKNNPIWDELRGYPGDAILFLKILEDELLYTTRERNTSSYISTYLQTVEQSELDFGIPLPLVREWHECLKLSFACRPSELFQRLATTHSKFSALSDNTILLVKTYLPKYRDNEKINHYLCSLFSEFERLFSLQDVRR